MVDQIIDLERIQLPTVKPREGHPDVLKQQP